MANFVHNLGLELNVYDADTDVAWTKQDINRQIQAGQPTIVRRAYLDMPRVDSLKSATEKADVIFENVANRCGAIVVAHTWGIAPAASAPGKRFHDKKHDAIIPRGYEIVAEVPVLTGIQPLDASHSVTVQDGLRNHRKLDPVIWNEANVCQFVQVIDPDTLTPQIVELDIDPMFYEAGKNIEFLC